MDIGTILISIFAAVVYSMSMYVKKCLNPENPQSFDALKFLATVIVGAIVGAVMAISEIPITEESFEKQFMAYMGLVALVENLLKIAYRVRKWKR